VSTMAQDNVYGLIALWQSKVQAAIVIDYAKPVAEVFANAVKIGLKMEETTSITNLWAAFDHSPSASATEGLPSWCPNFQYSIDPSPADVAYEPLMQTVKHRIEALACYKHTSGFETIAIRVLKLDTIAKTMTSACPAIAFQPVYEQYHGLLVWLQDLLKAVRSDDQADRSLAHDMQTYFYESIDFRDCPGFTLDVFSRCIALLWDPVPPDFACLYEELGMEVTLNILSHQSGRFFFLTDSGRLGYSARQPCSGGHIILVPGSDARNGLYMLTADCTQYVGCASVNGLMGDSLLESLDDMETKWEMVVLR
jgi:hypothetical protein